MTDPRSIPVRFSNLKQMAQSPAHYFQACQRDQDGPGTLAMKLGSGVHAMLFGQPWVAYPGRRAGKEWDAFELEHAGSVILNEREAATAKATADAVRANPLAASLLLAPDVVVEKRLDWMRDGRACRGTPDAVGDGFIVDLKTTKCAEPVRFVKDATWRGYHAQVAFYAAALETLGRQVTDLYIVAVESAAPHCVTVLRLDSSAWLAGNALVGSWWQRLRVCEESNEWPGYTDAMVRFGVEDNGDRLIIGGEEMDI